MSPASSLLPVLLLSLTWTLGQGTTGVYLIVYSSAQKWEDGRKCCEQNAMTLARPDTQAKFKALRDFMYNYMGTDYYTDLWTGLRAGNVSDFSTYTWADGSAFHAGNTTYTWADGSAFHAGNTSWIKWDTSAISEGPACFSLATIDYKWHYKNSLRADNCSKILGLGCEMTDPMQQPGPLQAICPTFLNFMLKPTPPGGLAQSAKGGHVVLRGRFSREWSTLQPFTHSRVLGQERTDCLLYCLRFNQTRGAQLSFWGSGPTAKVDKCTCMTGV